MKKNELGYNAFRFFQMLSEIGGVETARSLINKEDVLEGFCILVEKNRPDLTVESIVVEERFRELFSDEEIGKCKKRLREVGYIF